MEEKRVGPLNEKAYYMTPIAEVPNGHDGSIQTAACVLRKWTPMPTEGPDWRLVDRRSRTSSGERYERRLKEEVGG